MSRAKQWIFGVSFFVVLALACVAVFAQATGYRFTQNGITLAGNGTVCFESTYNAGPDVCVQRTGAGHIGILGGNLKADPDIMGSGTSPVSVTFTTAYTAAPLCVASDTSGTPAAIQVAATTTALTLTGTSGHTLNYVCFSNPN